MDNGDDSKNIDDPNDLKDLCASYDIINSNDLYYLRDFHESKDSVYSNHWDHLDKPNTSMHWDIFIH